jgi:hypothetical protein
MSGALYNRADALGAQDFTDFAAVLENRNLLQVRTESTVGSTQRKAAVMSESRRFATSFAFSHLLIPSSTVIAIGLPAIRYTQLSNVRFYHSS